MTNNRLPMHLTTVWISGNPHKIAAVNSIEYMRGLMHPVPVLTPKVAQHAAQARVVFGD